MRISPMILLSPTSHVQAGAQSSTSAVCVSVLDAFADGGRIDDAWSRHPKVAHPAR
jgi:hypothetical protein